MHTCERLVGSRVKFHWSLHNNKQQVQRTPYTATAVSNGAGHTGCVDRHTGPWCVDTCTAGLVQNLTSQPLSGRGCQA